ncbi:hypothetical protein KHA80_20660 [Anaerobacillus sp. HL2]|nr:hypothetical protein KHA80_20660 [Anaerobacillus sp. HL2]
MKKSLKALGISLNELHCIAKVKTTEAVISLVEASLGYSVVSSIAGTQAVQWTLRPFNHYLMNGILFNVLKERNKYILQSSHSFHFVQKKVWIKLFIAKVGCNLGIY